MKRVSLLLAFALVFISSCSDETTVFQESTNDLSLQENQDFLNESISFEKAGVLEISNNSGTSGKTGKAGDELAGDYPLSLIAQIIPPSFSGGENLTATHVNIVDNIAYVSYNTVESDYVGAIDVINVSDPYNPKITSRLYYTNADINAVAYENGFIYIVGGVDAETSVRATTNSFVAKIHCDNGRINIDAGITYGFQEGFIGTDIAISGNNLYVTSGKDGSLTIYDKNSVEILTEYPSADLRSVTIENDKIAVLDASKGVSIFDSNFSLIKEIGITSDFGTDSKRTIDFSNDRILVAEGSKGAGIYNTTSGDFIEYIPILINPENSDAGDNVTNAVAANEDAILMANGGAGLSISQETSESTNPVGIIDLDGSINYVASKGDYIFAASGTAGLQIIKMNKPNGSLATKCVDIANYKGSSKLNVDVSENVAYSGSKRLKNIDVNGQLLLCGSWTASDDVSIYTDGLFEMNGTLIVGNNSKRKDVILENNATFRVEGTLTIYGDLVLNEGAKLEFVGANSVVYVTGKVTKDNSASITGSFTDVLNKF